MTSNDIRQKYLKFFESKKHKVVSSDSLVPANDPSVLFTSAGMNQFKEQFMGINVTFKRAATSQKCLRTGDLEKVGNTSGHHTFFEMLGNFSFGDYFKKEAIAWAWEFMTSELKIPIERLWVSVYKDDDEAYDIWKNGINIPEHKIKRYGALDNFWPQNAIENGPDGPCGPCSEIFYDRGEDAGCRTAHCEPSCGCGRFIEVWNLVFTQFNRVGRNNLIPLTNKNIDTGMGLERITSVMQGVKTNFETDIFVPIIDEIYGLAGGKKPDRTFRVNAIADHIRAVVFMVSDGVLPSNEERGYVVRMLTRRAFRFGKELGAELPFLYKIVPSVARAMKEQYPEIETMRENIADVVLSEEKKFQGTLEEGTKVLENFLEDLRLSKKRTLSGKDMFRLYDTYGFPYELTVEMAESKGFAVDRAGYDKEMELQRGLARAKSRMKVSIFDDSRSEDTIKKLSETLAPTIFTGYSELKSEATILAIVKAGNTVKAAEKGDMVKLILNKTPFYGESGGQMGDAGEILWRLGKAKVEDTKKTGVIIAHICKITQGSLEEGGKVEAIIDRDLRLNMARNHTATHLLHYALREVLGKHVKQSGSLVKENRLRFDFTHFKAMEKRELDRVEEIINCLIMENVKVEAEYLGQEEAKKKGAMALFGEKYGKQVRVISIGEYSKELCGGTHLCYTGQIGLFRILSEGSIAGGIRRIEAVTGRAAYKSVKEDEEILSDIGSILKTPKQYFAKELERQRLNEKELSKINKQAVNIGDLMSDQREVNGVKIISGSLKGVGIEEIRFADSEIRKKIGSGLIVLGSVFDGKVSITCSASGDLVSRGINANDIIKKIAPIVSGSGGGKPSFAQAGGKDIGKLDEALNEVAVIIEKGLKK